MCRVAVRQTPRARAPMPQQQTEDVGLYEHLQAMPVIKDEIDFDKIFGDTDEIEIDAGM